MPLHNKKKNTEKNLIPVTMIDPVTALFEITQYDDKIAISIAKLVETTG